MSVDVTFLLATFNPSWDMLIKSVDSVIRQKNISIQLIVCDDGSAENYFRELEKYFEKKGFTEYMLLTSGYNQGTVRNVLQAKDVSKGRYICAFGAGDYIYKDTVFDHWVKYCDELEAKMSFGEIVNYQVTEKGDLPVRVRSIPHCLWLYKKRNRNPHMEMYDYLLVNDHVCGVAWLSDREAFFKYTGMLDGRVIYADDDHFRLMIYDGIKIFYFNEKVMYYENGIGVSTANNEKWNMLLKKDHLEANRIMCEMQVGDRFRKRIHDYLCSVLDEDRSKIRTIRLFIAFPEYIWLWIANKVCFRWSEGS